MKRKPIVFISGTLLGVAVALTMVASANRLVTFNELAREKGQKYSVNPNFIKAIISVESAGNINAVSPVGARGLMQLMPATAVEMGVTDIFDPAQNIAGGVQYLSRMLDLFNGNIDFALAGYNAGPENVKKYEGIPPFSETQNYVVKVLEYYTMYSNLGQ